MELEAELITSMLHLELPSPKLLSPTGTGPGWVFHEPAFSCLVVPARSQDLEVDVPHGTLRTGATRVQETPPTADDRETESTCLIWPVDCSDLAALQET